MPGMDELADRLAQVNDEFVAVVEPLSPEQWLTLCPEEQRTIAALARHVADGYAWETEAFRALANGQNARTWTRASLAESNAIDGRAYERCDQVETVQLLRERAADAVAMVRTFSDEQMDRRGVYVEELGLMTVRELVERILIWHPQAHLASIRAALGQTA